METDTVIQIVSGSLLEETKHEREIMISTRYSIEPVWISQIKCTWDDSYSKNYPKKEQSYLYKPSAFLDATFVNWKLPGLEEDCRDHSADCPFLYQHSWWSISMVNLTPTNKSIQCHIYLTAVGEATEVVAWTALTKFHEDKLSAFYRVTHKMAIRRATSQICWGALGHWKWCFNFCVK